MMYIKVVPNEKGRLCVSVDGINLVQLGGPRKILKMFGNYDQNLCGSGNECVWRVLELVRGVRHLGSLHDQRERYFATKWW